MIGDGVVDRVGAEIPLDLELLAALGAAQVLVATTARPPNAWNMSGSARVGISTISSTPGTVSVSVAS